jgi:hypothetical protein
MMETSKRFFYLLLIYFVVGSSAEVHSQPYYYTFRYKDDFKSAFFLRINLQSDQTEFLAEIFRPVKIFMSVDQSRIYVLTASSLQVMKPEGLERPLQLMSGIENVLQVLEAPSMNRVYVSTGSIEDVYDRTIVLDFQTLTPIDTIHSFYAFDQPFISSDGNKIYRLKAAQSGIFFQALNPTNGIVESEAACGTLGPFAFNPGLEAARAGKALVRYQVEHGSDWYIGQEYVTCDPMKTVPSKSIRFPWRSEGYLSGDASHIIIEEVRFAKSETERYEYRPGTIYVYESKTGKLTQHLALPPQGKVLVFDNYPEKFFYYIEGDSLSESLTVDVTAITPTDILLDTLISMKHQAFSNGWLADKSFVKELDNQMENAQKHLAKHDSINARKEIEEFQEKVDKEYQKTLVDHKRGKHRDRRFLTEDGWKLLHFNAQYVIDRLPEKSKHGREGDKDKKPKK